MSRVKWSIYGNDQYIGDFIAEEVCRITGMRRNNISTYADLGTAYKGVYRIERIGKVPCQEWEETVNSLKQKA